MSNAPLLVCLDLQAISLDDARPHARQQRMTAARTVIDRARGGGWEIAHICRSDIAGPATPLPGLGPLPCEPLFRREGVSAFGARAFGDLLRRRGAASIALLSLDLGCGALVTALTAVEQGHQVALLTDAADRTPFTEAVHDLVAALKQGGVQLRRFATLPPPTVVRLTLAANQA